jgi:plasmid stabilization system protein ParE
VPVFITGAARSQYLGMVSRYLLTTLRRPPRPDAARRLIETYDVAVQQIAAGPRSWMTHPRPYPGLARYGFRWIKAHRYWFAYQAGPSPVITNIFDEAGDIPRQISADRLPVEVA